MVSNVNTIPSVGQRRLFALIFLLAAGSLGATVAARLRSKTAESYGASQLRPLDSREARPISAVVVRTKHLQAQNQLSGQAEPYETATVAAEVNAQILQRPVVQGDQVERGGLLAVLNANLAETTLMQVTAAFNAAVAGRQQAEAEYERVKIETSANIQVAEAQLTQSQVNAKKVSAFTRPQELLQAQSRLRQAQTEERLSSVEYNRTKTLTQEGALSQQMLDRAQAALEQTVAARQQAEQSVSLATEGARTEDIDASQAQVQSAQASLRAANTRDMRLATLRKQIENLNAQEQLAQANISQARIQLGKYRIYAPFRARILATPVQEGEMVASGTPVVRIGSIERIKAVFYVPETTRVSLRAGQNVWVTVDALNNRRFQGRIKTLGYQAEARTRAFPIEITIANPQEVILPNMVVRLSLPFGPGTDRAVIPLSAIAMSGEQSYVYVVQNGKAKRREVALGAPSGNLVEVLQGLKPGEKIASAPQRLTDGMKVRVVPH